MPLHPWETFYVIVGSSAAALTGLMFVVIALVADFRGSQLQLEAFGTPTVVHFDTGILVAASGLPRRPTPLLFVIGGATVLLLFIGIHDAWDTVSYIVVSRWEERNRDEETS